MKTSTLHRGVLRKGAATMGFAVLAAAAAAAQYYSPPPPPPAAPPPAPEPSAPAPPAPAPVGSVDLPPGLSEYQVQSAIFSALHHRGWSVVSANPGSIVAHILRHRVDETITVQYGPARVDIYAQAYAVGRHGEREVSPLVRGDWIRNLEHDIPRYAVGG